MPAPRTWFIFLSIFFLLLPTAGVSQDRLNEVRLFYRCYAQIAQLRPKFSDPLLAQVKAGTKTAVEACMEVLDSARLTASGGLIIADSNDPVAKSTLNNFHQLHRGWSRETGLFLARGVPEQRSSQAWFEDNPMGLYFTRALFSSAHDVRSVLQGSEYLIPVRTDMNPSSSYDGLPDSDTLYRLGDQMRFAPQGELVGVLPTSLPAAQVFAQSRPDSMNGLPDLESVGPAQETAVVPNINFPNLSSVRGPLTVDTNFAIRFTGVLEVPTTGSYTFRMESTYRSTLVIGDHIVFLDRNSGGGITSPPFLLSAGEYEFRLEYRRRASSNPELKLSWDGPGFGLQFIPAANFSHQASGGSFQPGLFAEYWDSFFQQPPMEYTKSEGGGFIGNHNYLQTSFHQTEGFDPDGALRMNRSWPRAVLADTVCREIPVIRESDAEPFVIPGSSVSFRAEAACNQCHATTDRMSSAIRGFRWNVLDTLNFDDPVPDELGFMSLFFLSPILPEYTQWTDQSVSFYSRRAPYGHFFFRDYEGNLVDQIVRSPQEIADIVLGLDDFYICVAKRYYKYFLGIDTVFGDPGEPTYPTLNAPEIYHRQQVRELGLALRNHRDPRLLIQSIISSEAYRQSDFGISFTGAN